MSATRRTPITLRDRIAELARSLPPAQERVARLLDELPDVVAFGTVAEVAEAAATSPQTVLRLAGRLGHAGFAALQDEVRDELVARLPRASSRIRQGPARDPRRAVLAADESNVAVSLDVDEAELGSVVDLLADDDRTIAVLSAESWVGVGALFAGHLVQLRDGVVVLDGPVPRVARQVAMLGEGDVVIAIDVRRYERWVADAAAQALDNRATLVAISDGPTSPLFAEAAHRFVVGVGSPGPFESATGVVSLLHLLVTSTAARMRDRARGRLDAVEQAWSDRDALFD